MVLRTAASFLLVAAGFFGFNSNAQAQNDWTADVTGTVKQGQKTGTLTGTVEIQKFKIKNEELVAIGTLNGIVEFDNGKTRKLKNVRVALPVDLEKSGISDSAAGLIALNNHSAALQCDVLNLVLGPLDLNLLGLQVHLDQVVLDIVADPTGGLLGSLLGIFCNLNLTTLADILGFLGDLDILAAILNLIMLLG